jgi:hypothetical protein
VAVADEDDRLFCGHAPALSATQESVAGGVFKSRCDSDDPSSVVRQSQRVPSPTKGKGKARKRTAPLRRRVMA